MLILARTPQSRRPQEPPVPPQRPPIGSRNRADRVTFDTTEKKKMCPGQKILNFLMSLMFKLSWMDDNIFFGFFFFEAFGGLGDVEE